VQVLSSQNIDEHNPDHRSARRNEVHCALGGALPPDLGTSWQASYGSRSVRIACIR
jgi:hypothetical protein